MIDPHRLPRHALPSRYEVRLEPDLEAATFTGSVLIDVDVAESDPTVEGLVLNAAELTIHSARIDGAEATFVVDPEIERGSD